MKKYLLLISLVLSFCFTQVAQADSKSVVLLGTVTAVSGNQVYFKTTSTAKYSAELSYANLIKKNGSPMQVNEIYVGDKLEVRGQLWSDNSLNVTQLKDLSLYAHSSTFTGKITNIDFANASFVLESGAKTRKVTTNNMTNFKVNGTASTFTNLTNGMTVKLKAFWERADKDLLAESIEAKTKVLNITITGSLVMKSSEGFTVVAENNVIYGVNLNQAKLVSTKGKALSVSSFNLGDAVKVEGKHAAESVTIYNAKIRNLVSGK